jgi:hypothetical protein
LDYDPPENVVVVAKSGGDYSSVNTALSNVSGPATVWVAPGEYDISEDGGPSIPKDVSLVGAGRRATTLYSTNNFDGIRAPNGGTEIRSLRIEWRTGNSSGNIVQADDSNSDLLLYDVHVEDDSGSINHGLGVGNGEATVENSVIRQSIKNAGQGIQVFSGTLTVRNSIVEGRNNGIDIDSGGTVNLANNQIFATNGVNDITNGGSLNKFGNYDDSYSTL